jgi:hypothetical protein
VYEPTGYFFIKTFRTLFRDYVDNVAMNGGGRGFNVFIGISSPSNIFFSYPTCPKPTTLEGEVNWELLPLSIGEMSEIFNARVPVYWDTVRDRYPLELKPPAHSREWIWVIQSTQASRGRVSEVEFTVRHGCDTNAWWDTKWDTMYRNKINYSRMILILPNPILSHITWQNPPSHSARNLCVDMCASRAHHPRALCFITGKSSVVRKCLQYACFNVKVIFGINMASVNFNHRFHIKACWLQSACIR